MKIIFLDIDGVLNSQHWMISNHAIITNLELSMFQRDVAELDPVAIELTKRIVDATGAKIVISSSWRILHDLEEIHFMIKTAGWDAPIIDETPRILEKGSVRGDEVDMWLMENTRRLGIKRYVCLDDNSDFHEGQNLIQTTWKFGIQQKHVDEAIKILNK